MVYDSAGRLKVTEDQTVLGRFNQTILSTITYDAASRVTSITYGYATTSTALATYSYSYDNANRLTSETNAEGTLSYTYDTDSELTGVSGASAATYTYDNNGNRTMTGYSTGGDNTLTAGAGYTYTYDAEGNQTGKTQISTGYVWTNTWDYRNRLTGVVEKTSGGTVLMQGTYTYDAMDRRIGVDETVSGTETKTWTVYDGVNSYADFSGSGALLTRYIYGPGANQILGRVSASGTEAWYLADHEGTIRDIVGTTGTVLDHIAYDAYGNVTSESNASNGDRFKFDGMAWDAAIGLYYDNARYYDSSSGRFVSQDPLKFESGGYNFYSYTKNSPEDLIDPSGRQAQQPNPPQLQAQQRHRAVLAGGLDGAGSGGFATIAVATGTSIFGGVSLSGGIAVAAPILIPAGAIGGAGAVAVGKPAKRGAILLIVCPVYYVYWLFN